MLNSYDGKTVLVTGGTRGIGLACGLAFGKLGAQLYLTHRWGSADEDALRAQFADLGAPEPVIVEADVSQKKETKALMERIKSDGRERVDVFISNVAAVMRPEGLHSHKERALLQSLDYSAWPLVEYLHAMKRAFERYPRYVVAMSSDGPDAHYPGYDYVAISKAVLETFVRYMAVHLLDEGVNINALRSRQVMTESYEDIFGEAGKLLASKFPELMVSPEEVARTTLALCSGLLDGVSGQTITLDRGAGFVDNLMTLGHRAFGVTEG